MFQFSYLMSYNSGQNVINFTLLFVHICLLKAKITALFLWFLR